MISLPPIEQALQSYFDGLYHGDVHRLRQVFHPKATYTTVTGGVFVHKTVDEYLPIVQDRPSPAAGGQIRQDRLISVEMAGPVTAVVRAECTIGTRHFTDLLSFIYLDGRWQIIAKVFHYTESED